MVKYTEMLSEENKGQCVIVGFKYSFPKRLRDGKQC